MAKILLVDDMNGVRSSLSMVLKTAGHDVIEAENGQVGLEKCRNGNFDLVITDIVMPEVDGSEVILNVKKSAPALPVLAISGGGSSISAEQALILAKETADSVLAKPFSRQELLDEVNRLITKVAA
ncbi:MAG: response regulator [Pseudomonadota bacterium]